MRDYLKREDDSDVGMVIDSAIYFVMKHYSLSLRDIDSLSPAEFDMMFTWAAAVEEHQAEQHRKQTESSNSKAPVAGTSMGTPMPYSKESW